MLLSRDSPKHSKNIYEPQRCHLEHHPKLHRYNQATVACTASKAGWETAGGHSG